MRCNSADIRYTKFVGDNEFLHKLLECSHDDDEQVVCPLQQSGLSTRGAQVPGESESSKSSGQLPDLVRIHMYRIISRVVLTS